MKVTVIGNTINPRSHDGMYVVTAWLMKQGIEAEVIESVDTHSLAEDEARVAEDTERIDGSSLVVACGGDGTTLHAARLVGYREIPIVSFNFGHLGFLASSSEKGIIDKLTTILAGEVEPMHRATISADVTFEDGSQASYFALNEIVFARGESGRIVELGMGINGQHIATLRGDGVIIATATGSTAYALSAGGPIVAPTHTGLTVVPLAPHSLFARPIVTDGNDCVEIERHDLPYVEADIFVDGRKPTNAIPNRMVVSRGKGDILYIEFSKNSFYRTVAETFYRGDAKCYPN